MKLQQLLFSLLLPSLTIVLVITPAMSEEVKVLDVKPKNRTTEKEVSYQQQLSRLNLAQPPTPTKKIQRLSEIERFFTSAQKLVQSPAPSSQTSPEVLQVTKVKLESTNKGLELILETTSAQKLQVVNKTEGNNFIADIPGVQLRLPSGDAFQFRSDKPAEGITSVVVTNQDANTIRVTVTGTTKLPTVELFDSDQGLIFGLTPASSTAQVPQPQPPQQQETTQPDRPENQNPPKQPSTDGNEPIELVVTGEQDRYRATDTNTATKTDTRIRDIPQSIQVVPRQVLEDQQVIRVGEALQNVSGITNLGSYSGYEDYIYIRGFVAQGFNRNFYRDGVPYFQFDFIETANLERIEVLKGPSSVLFGQGQPGGIINLVTKQPLAEPYYSASFTAGNFDTYRGLLDLSGPLNEDKTLRYRLNISYDNAGSFRDFVSGERFFISPVISWDISPKTSLKIDAEFIHDSRTMDDGIPAFGRGIADIPIDRFLNEPFSRYRKTEFSIGYDLTHQFSDNWSVRNTVRFQHLDPERYYPLTSSLDETTGELSRLAYYAGGYYNQFFANADVVGKFATGPIQHKLLFGLEYRANTEEPEFRFPDYSSINIFNPVYINQRYPKEPTFFRDDNYKTYGAYIQDQIDLLPNLKLLAGVRFDSFDQFRTTRNLGQPRREFSQSDTAFSPRVGIVYQPSDNVSLYASYTESFAPSNAFSRNNGSAFEPETGRQYEVGIKADLLNNGLSLTMAAFDLKKQNVTTSDPVNPTFSFQTGEQTSRGIEFNVSGVITPGWNIIASYTYLDAFVSNDLNRNLVDNRLENVPEHSASLWTTYELQKGNLKGLGFGLGLYYIGDRYGDLDNTYTIPSYLRTDAALYYRRDNWRAALNIKNLFDIEYFSGSDGSRTRVQPGAPFTILGTLSLEF